MPVTSRFAQLPGAGSSVGIPGHHQTAVRVKEKKKERERKNKGGCIRTLGVSFCSIPPASPPRSAPPRPAPSRPVPIPSCTCPLAHCGRFVVVFFQRSLSGRVRVGLGAFLRSRSRPTMPAAEADAGEVTVPEMVMHWNGSPSQRAVESNRIESNRIELN